MRELCQIFDISPRGEEPGKARHGIVLPSPAPVLPVNSDTITDRETDRTGTLRTTGQISILPTQDLGIRMRLRLRGLKYFLSGQHLSLGCQLCPSNEFISLLSQCPGGPVDHPAPSHSHYGVLCHFLPSFLRREWPTSALSPMVNIKSLPSLLV